MKIIIATIILLSCASGAQAAFVPETPEQVERYVEAIYKAEGGDKAQYPYGIRSVKCNTKAECRRIAQNTVRNNIRRYKEYGHKTHATYLDFLASRYAPIGAKNDPRNLNANWKRNVLFFLERGA